MPTARNLLKLTELDGQVYAIGGFDDNGNEVSAVERYNPHHDSWQAVAPMGSPQAANPGVVTVGGWIVVVGGGLDIGEVYDPHADKWHRLAARLPTVRASLVAAHEHKKVILAIGGSDPTFRAQPARPGPGRRPSHRPPLTPVVRRHGAVPERALTASRTRTGLTTEPTAGERQPSHAYALQPSSGTRWVHVEPAGRGAQRA